MTPADSPKVLLLPGPDLASRIQSGDLQYADLTSVKDLLPRQLAGADLTGAKLPEQLEAFPGIVHVSELVRTAATVFLSLLVACVYSWLTIQQRKTRIF